jgi:gamma-glutamyltranspeptidase/glutathione hydrolase
MAGRGVVAAGHPATAVAGAAVLRAGGNAVDAAVLTSLVAAPLLTGLGAGGYLPMAPPDGRRCCWNSSSSRPAAART